MLKCIPSSKRPMARKKLLAYITKYNNDIKLNTIGIETVRSLKSIFPADMLDAYTTLPFEDGEFMCFADWDNHLKAKFGDYMQLPPESERGWRHHPVILDFTHNCEEL